MAPTTAAFALSSPIRFEMLQALATRPYTIGELATLVGQHPSTSSFHVDVLRRAGLVDVTPVANRRIVRVKARVIEFHLLAE